MMQQDLGLLLTTNSASDLLAKVVETCLRVLNERRAGSRETLASMIKSSQPSRPASLTHKARQSSGCYYRSVDIRQRARLRCKKSHAGTYIPCGTRKVYLHVVPNCGFGHIIMPSAPHSRAFIGHGWCKHRAVVTTSLNRSHVVSRPFDRDRNLVRSICLSCAA
jgi:hypothetical protein